MRLPQVDCRHYKGYKPCGLREKCDGDCPEYVARGRQILIVKLGAMGDVLRTTPVLRALREKWPQAWICWLTDPQSEPLLRHNPLVDELFIWGYEAGLQVQARQWDLLLNFEKEPRALALDNRTSAGEKRGFALHPAGGLTVHNPASRYALQLGIDDPLKFYENLKTMPAILLEMAKMPSKKYEYVLEPGEKALRFARDFDAFHRVRKSGKPVIGLNTGCGAVFPTKQWPLENWKACISALHETRRFQLLLLGGKREQEMNAALLEKAPPEALIDGGCDNDLEDFMGLVSLCDGVVSADSLAMHLAVGLQKNVVALLGPTSATEIDLYDRGKVLKTPVDCAPCYRTSCARLPNCMTAISPAEVARTVEKLFPE